MIQLTKKEYNMFLKDIQKHIENLYLKIKKNDSSFILNFDFHTVRKIEDYYNSLHEMTQEDVLEFWAYIGCAVLNYVGGEWILAPKSEDVAFTPIIINYGYKKKWKIRISPEVWREKLVTKKLLFPISQLIENLNNDYGKEK
jgi:hypothetical protein